MPNALKEINKLPNRRGHSGVGSVIDAKTAQAAIEAGAQFVVTPVSKPEVIQMAHQYQKPILSGAMTPSEILQAYEWGRCGQTFSRCRFWPFLLQSRKSPHASYTHYAYRRDNGRKCC